MVGRSRSPAARAGRTLGGTLDDVKAGARAGAVKGAAAGALGVLGAKVASAAQDVLGSNGDAKGKARKARKSTGKALSGAAETARKKADVEGKVSAGNRLLQVLGRRTEEVTQTATDGGTDAGWNVKVDVNDIPRLLRGTALVATGLGTIFAPGSALDVSSRVDGDMDQLAEQARQGIDTAANVTQQRIKDVIDLARDALLSFSEALQEGLETTQRQAQQALEGSEALVTATTEQIAEAAQPARPRKKGGTLRWLFYGLLLGGLAGFLSSPFSGPIGERIMNLRRDLGLGGEGSSESQYWPSQPQQSATGTPGATSSPQASAETGKTESWSQSSDVKEGPDKA